MTEGEAQVAQALLNFLDERGADEDEEGAQIIRGIVRQRDIADYVGCDRTSVAKPLAMLKKRGVIWYPNQGHHVPHRFKVYSRLRLEAYTVKNKNYKRNVHHAHFFLTSLRKKIIIRLV